MDTCTIFLTLVWTFAARVMSEQYQGEDAILRLLARVEQLETKVLTMQTTIVIQNRELTELKLENTQIKIQVAALNKETALSDDVDNLSEVATETDVIEPKKHGDYKSGHKTIRTTAELPVAFSAFVSPEHLTFGANQDIVFDHVETNMGSAYNSNHGVFIAPMGGLYLFTTSLTSWVNTELQASIAVNGRHIANVFTHGTIREDQGSQSAILKLNAGDDVSVQVRKAGEGILGHNYSSFSGYLLVPLE